MYYLNSRFYDSEIGRFVNEDIFVSTGIGLLGNNAYAYCSNNPVNNIDSLGMWTVSLSVSVSAVFGLGSSFSIGVAFDNKGNFEPQYSYAVLGIDNTAMVGGVGIGGGVALQFTKAGTIYDLHGLSTSVGGSVGPMWYVGGDVISFSDASDLNMTSDGGQIVLGVGCGVDVHVMESYTRPIYTQKKSGNKIATPKYSRNMKTYTGYTPMLY